MVAMLFLFFLGTATLLISIIGEDLVNVSKYLISEDNFNRPQQGKEVIFFNPKNDVLDITRRCLNQEGDITSQLNLNSPQYSNLNNLYSIYNDVVSKRKGLESLNVDSTVCPNCQANLITAYKKLEENIEKIESLFHNKSSPSQMFSFVNCGFLGRNVNILMDELKFSLGRDIFYFSIVICVIACAMAMAFLTGFVSVIRFGQLIRRDGKVEMVEDYGAQSENKNVLKKMNKSDEIALNEKVKGTSDEKIKKHPFDELKDEV